jgi:dipeptidyl aminopeptidase/acylaminoacyl peptidase
MKSFAPFSLVMLLLAPLSAAAQPKKSADWTPELMMRVKKISSVQVSPDGKRVVYAVREALLDKGRSEYLTHIFLVNEDGSNTVKLTQGDKSCEEPQWSPDGEWIAFLSARSGKRNLWLISPKGGDPVQVTTMKIAISSFKWSPDSKQIAFTATDGLTEKEEKAKKEKNDARVVDENYKMSRLHVVSIKGKEKQEARVLTTGDYHVPPTGRGGYDWSPDCKTIVYTRSRTPLADDWTSNDLQLIDVEKGSVRAVLPSGPVRFSPFFSPDGQSIAFVESDRTWAGSGRVHIHKLDDKASRPIHDTIDGWGRYSEILGWSSNGKNIYYTEAVRTGTRIGFIAIEGILHHFRLPERSVASGVHLNASRTHVGFVWESAQDAPEVHITPVHGVKLHAVSKVNADLPKAKLGKTEVIKWKSWDDLEIEGILTYPADYKPGQRYPLLLNIHGGPMGVFLDTYVPAPGLYPIAAFSSRGYFVLRPNPRGSSGYGKKFRYANYNDWGGGDYQDIMTGVDHVIQMGVADEKRLGIMGWSYGGFMTSWTITQTTRFKAASVGAGVTNLMSFTGTADIPSFLPDYFAGEFWDKPEVYRKHSAMFNIKGVKTPTLIQHGERDERVPLSQGEELYNALKRQGCTTKMVIYPRTPHGIEEPRLLVDCMERNLEWFDRYVK